MQGLIIVNTGLAITQLMKRSEDAHGLKMKTKVSEYISYANGMAIQVLGMTRMYILLMLTLDIEVTNVAVCLGDFYQNLLGCYMVYRHNKALSWL